MIQETDDDRLDQSLRDTFSDFDLPPSHQVWTGIESKLSTLPGAPRSVPLGFVLPFVGLVGVAVGWLLPRPALAPAPRPASEVPVKARMTNQQLVSSALSTYIIPRASTRALASSSSKPAVVAPVAASGNKSVSRLAKKGAGQQPRTTVFAATITQPTSTSAPGHTALVEAPSANTAPVVESNDLLAAIAISLESTATSVSAVLPSIVEQEHQVASAQQLATAKEAGVLELNVRGELLRERRPDYRVPTHRLAERGRGLRRIQNTVVRQWQRVFAPRRAGAAPKDF